jgi:hypothetical protein
VVNDSLRDPVVLGILAGTATTLLLTRTRFAKAAIAATLLTLYLTSEAARFDGLRHPGEMFDATLFFWARAVERRAAAGVAILLLGPASGAVFGAALDHARGPIHGMVAALPFGLGMLTSSVLLQVSFRSFANDVPGVRWSHLQAAVHESAWVLGVGTTASVIASAAIVTALVRRQGAHRKTGSR